ncbi:MAG: CoA transferase [Gammaproteobacteria bacterium]|nr:CoA transferase [Gammaproteobacteria bacterium]
MTDTPPKQPFLAGIRVLDLSQYIPGPFATYKLAELGAEVTKIEPPSGDPMRYFGIPKESRETSLSPVYQYLNQHKTIILLDLKEPENRTGFEKMLKQADVLLESYRPGVLSRLGFPSGKIAEINPGLIHCALSGWGQDGPRRHKPGHDLTYLAAAGGFNVNRYEQPPRITFPPVADHSAALDASNQILAALFARERTGQGAYLDISIYQSALSWHYLNHLNDTDQIDALLSGEAACYNIYQTSDKQFIALAALEDKFWHAFCEAVERPDWIERVHEPLPQTDLTTELKILFSSYNLAKWQALLDGADCCFEPLLTTYSTSQI